jgi:hypothetical protein
MENFSKNRESMNKSSSKVPKSVFQRTLYFTPHCTEGRAFLIHFQNLFLKDLFIRIKIARRFKFMSE